jgi:APA family basic amino acid/polyamine antiporter
MADPQSALPAGSGKIPDTGKRRRNSLSKCPPATGAIMPHGQPDPNLPSSSLPRVLGPTEAYCVVVGSVIGSGIFLVPASVATNVPFLGGILLVWLLGGLLSAAGALTLAELGAMMPHAGGPYVYLRAAYGRLPAYLFGWTEFTVARAGSMATLAAAFARYFVQLARAPAGIHPQVWQSVVAVLAIAVVTMVNILGTKRGGTLQVFGTVLKVGGVLGLMTLPFLLGGGQSSNLTPLVPGAGQRAIFTGMLAAMVSVLWAYDGWVNITPLAEEIRDPSRSIPRALVLGMATLILVYTGMTLAYHYVLPMEDVIGANRLHEGTEQAVAAVYCNRLLGTNGVIAISLLVMCSTFISLNGNALSGPRAYFAMARDGLLPRALGQIHARYRTPANAVRAQGLWAVVLTIAATALIVFPPPVKTAGFFSPLWTAWKTLNSTPLYDLLLTYVIFGTTVFNLLTVGSVFVLRYRQPEIPRPYRTWGYPWTPALFVMAALLLLGNMLIDDQSQVQSVAGLGLILLGVPASWLLRHRDRRSPGG